MWLKAIWRCILSKFYIKPQLRLERELSRCVVSYRNSTSNHNCGTDNVSDSWLYLIEILHQTTTNSVMPCTMPRLYLIEILHQTTTIGWFRLLVEELYLIEILHQTTTRDDIPLKELKLYLIEILHQTTTVGPHID